MTWFVIAVVVLCFGSLIGFVVVLSKNNTKGITNTVAKQQYDNWMAANKPPSDDEEFLREYMTEWQIERLKESGMLHVEAKKLRGIESNEKSADFVDQIFDGPNDYEPTQASIWKAGIRQESWRLVNLGKLERKDKCENCGQPYPQMHHTSYEDAAHIKWLCPACHKAWHREYGWPKAPKKVR